MAGFGNSIMYAKNMNFDELGPKPILGIINAAGKLPIGTGNLSPTPEILGGSITSPDSSVTVGYSSPNITLQVAGGTSTIKTITGNDSVPQSPIAGNFNFLTSNSSVKFLGTAATETLNFGLSNLLLGASGAAITSGTSNTTLGQNAGAALSGVASSNTLIGFTSGLNITTSFSNTAVGYLSLSSFTSGAANAGANTALGIASLGNLQTGVSNIGLGATAGNQYAGAESSNIVIGSPGVALESNTIRIGQAGSGGGQQNRAFVAGVTAVTVAASAPIAVDTNGQISSLGFGTANQVLTSNGAGSSPTFQAASASGAITTITGSSGGAQSPSAGNFNILGTGSITSVGTANTETIQLTGLTNFNVLVGAGTATITKVAPSATSGVPLISQGAAANPVFGTALVAGGGTGITSTTAYGLIAGGTTTTGNFQNTGAGTSGQYLKSNGAAALPAFAALPSQASNAGVYLNSTISNATGDGTFVTPVIFDTENFDLGNNFDTTTGLFTIPTTGKYLVCVGITFTGLLVAHTSAEVRIVANGATVTRNQFNPFVASVSGQYTYYQSLVIAGTAAQTISIVAAVSGGTKVVGFLGASFGQYCVASFTFLG